jgi:CyaY protein
MITEPDFSRKSEVALGTLNRTLDVVAEDHDVEILYQAGVLTLEIEEPAVSKIVVSPNSPARQIWISAQSTSFKLGWSAEKSAFVLASTGETLNALIGRLVAEELGVDPIQI